MEPDPVKFGLAPQHCSEQSVLFCCSTEDYLCCLVASTNDYAVQLAIQMTVSAVQLSLQRTNFAVLLPANYCQSCSVASTDDNLCCLVLLYMTVCDVQLPTDDCQCCSVVPTDDKLCSSAAYTIVSMLSMLYSCLIYAAVQLPYT